DIAGNGGDHHQDHQQPLHARSPVVDSEVDPTSTAPMTIRIVPAHRWGVTTSCRNVLPRNAARTYPIAVTGSTKLRSARLSSVMRERTERISSATPSATAGLSIASK